MDSYLKDMLDSDDELSISDDYEETPFIPAYLKNDRFDYIEVQKRKNEPQIVKKLPVPFFDKNLDYIEEQTQNKEPPKESILPLHMNSLDYINKHKQKKESPKEETVPLHMNSHDYIEEQKQKKEPPKEEKVPLHMNYHDNDSKQNNRKVIENENIKIKRGFLNEKDILCLQCIKTLSSDTVFWFLRYLMFKDLQKEYKFLKSCLVPKYENYYSSFNNKVIFDKNVNKRPVTIIVTK